MDNNKKRPNNCPEEQITTANKIAREPELYESYDTRILIEKKYKDLYQCDICRCIINQAVSPSNTDVHAFCKRCLKSTRCPKCDKMCSNPPISVPFIDATINQLEVYCYAKEIGCAWTGTLQALHKKHWPSCEHQPTCSLCNEKYHDSKEIHLETCPKKEIHCDSCGIKLLLGEMTVHNQTCAEKIISCGKCPKQILRRLQQQHENFGCLSSIVTCNRCFEICRTSDPCRCNSQMIVRPLASFIYEIETPWGELQQKYPNRKHVDFPFSIFGTNWLLHLFPSGSHSSNGGVDVFYELDSKHPNIPEHVTRIELIANIIISEGTSQICSRRVCSNIPCHTKDDISKSFGFYDLFHGMESAKYNFHFQIFGFHLYHRATFSLS